MKVYEITYLVYNLYFVNRTWPGPAWSPAQTLSSLLISIQSLLNEKPYHNEPGFERKVSKFPGRVVLPITAYTGRLRLKGVPFSTFSYVKGYFTSSDI